MTVGEKIDQMTDEDIITVWRNLGKIDWSREDMHSPGVSMNDWADLICCEMDRRGLSH